MKSVTIKNCVTFTSSIFFIVRFAVMRCDRVRGYGFCVCSHLILYEENQTQNIDVQHNISWAESERVPKRVSKFLSCYSCECLRAHAKRRYDENIVDTAQPSQQTQQISMMYARVVLALVCVCALFSSSALFVVMCAIFVSSQWVEHFIHTPSIHRKRMPLQKAPQTVRLHGLWCSCFSARVHEFTVSAFQQDWCGFNGISSERGITRCFNQHQKKERRESKNVPTKEWFHKKATITN